MLNVESSIEQLIAENKKLKAQRDKWKSLYRSMEGVACMYEQSASDFDKASAHAYLDYLKSMDCGCDRYLIGLKSEMIRHVEKWLEGK